MYQVRVSANDIISNMLGDTALTLRLLRIIVFWVFVFVFFYKFIYLFLAVLGLCCCARAFSRCSEGGYSSLRCAGFSLQWLLLLWSTGSRHVGFSSCVSWALERTLSSGGVWGLVAPQHVGSSQTRDRTRVPCIGRRILMQCATREVPGFLF